MRLPTVFAKSTAIYSAGKLVKQEWFTYNIYILQAYIVPCKSLAPPLIAHLVQT